MLTYLISLGASVLVGIIYSLINVRSPAPPLVALVGVLGILVGEQIILGRQAAPGRFGLLGRLARGEVHVAYVWHAAGPACRRSKDFRDRFLGETHMTDAPDLIVTNARVSTLDRANPTATAVAITDGKFFTRPPWSARLPVRDLRSFWGALGCSCWAA